MNRLSSTAVLSAILLASLGALATAFAGQYLFGLEPCVLCLYERVPYALTGLIAAAALVLPVGEGGRGGAAALCAFLFLAGAALAFYHVGIEEHWWTSTIPGCTGRLPADLSLEELRARLAAPPRRPCDEVDWRLFGITLAGYNGVVSLALAIASAAGARLIGKGAKR